jgi:hypothetical protein
VLLLFWHQLPAKIAAFGRFFGSVISTIPHLIPQVGRPQRVARTLTGIVRSRRAHPHRSGDTPYERWVLRQGSEYQPARSICTFRGLRPDQRPHRCDFRPIIPPRLLQMGRGPGPRGERGARVPKYRINHLAVLAGTRTFSLEMISLGTGWGRLRQYAPSATPPTGGHPQMCSGPPACWYILFRLSDPVDFRDHHRLDQRCGNVRFSPKLTFVPIRPMSALRQKRTFDNTPRSLGTICESIMRRRGP